MSIEGKSGVNGIERKIGLLFDEMAADPAFSKLDEQEQAGIEKELVDELIERNDYVVTTPVNAGASIELRPVDVSLREYVEISGVMKDEIKNIDSDSLDIESELAERAAFRMVDMPYMRPGDERDRMLYSLGEDELECFITSFQDALEKAYAVQRMGARGITYKKDGRFVYVANAADGAGAAESVLEPTAEEVVVEEEEKKKPGFISRHKRLIGLGLLALVGGAAYAGINWYNSPKQKLIRLAGGAGIAQPVAESFYDGYPDMSTALLGTNSTKLLPAMELYSENATLLKELYSSSMSDPQIVVDRNAVAADSANLALRLGAQDMHLGKEGIHLIGNMTVEQKQGDLPKGYVKGTIGHDAIKTAVTALEQSRVVDDGFDSSRLYMNLVRFAKHVPELLAYPLEWRAGTLQVDDTLYDEKLDILGHPIAPLANVGNEGRIWNVIRKASMYIADKINSGEASYELGYPDKNVDMTYRMNRLLPKELWCLNIRTGEYRNKLSVDVGEYNVNPDNDNLGGLSPRQWLDDMAKRDFAEKKNAYSAALNKGILVHPGAAWGEWSESERAFLQVFGNRTEFAFNETLTYDGIMKEDDLAVFIQGYPRFLRGGIYSDGLPVIDPVIPGLVEQRVSEYSKFIASAFGRSAFVAGYKYPNSGGYHDEPFIFISPQLSEKLSAYGELTYPFSYGWWLFKEPLLKDYEGALYPIG